MKPIIFCMIVALILAAFIVGSILANPVDLALIARCGVK